MQAHDKNSSGNIIRKPLLTAILDRAPRFDRVEIKSITLAPGQKAGLHDHPCHVVGYVAAGTIHFQIDGQPPQTLQAGDAFHEPIDTRILHFDAGESGPATFIAFYLLNNDQHELIRMLD